MFAGCNDWSYLKRFIQDKLRRIDEFIKPPNRNLVHKPPGKFRHDTYMMKVEAQNPSVFAEIPQRQHGHQVVAHHYQGVRLARAQSPAQWQIATPTPFASVADGFGWDLVFLEDGSQCAHFI
jgi:hypothetical protein